MNGWWFGTGGTILIAAVVYGYTVASLKAEISRETDKKLEDLQNQLNASLVEHGREIAQLDHKIGSLELVDPELIRIHSEKLVILNDRTNGIINTIEKSGLI